MNFDRKLHHYLSRLFYLLLMLQISAHARGQSICSYDTLIINSEDMNILSSSDQDKVIEFFHKHTSGVVLLSSQFCDSILFAKINAYRLTQGVPVLTYSERLDTLGKKVLYWLHHDDETRHYSSMPQMKEYRDLMNVENIAYIHSLGNETFRFDPDETLNHWINSPPHNRGLLADLHVGSVSSLAKLTMYKGKLIIEIFSVFECDHTVSKRELNAKYEDLNKNLIKRPIKFKRTIN